MMTISVIPKEYDEKFRNHQFNKRQKGMQEDTGRLIFEAYAQRIMN